MKKILIALTIAAVSWVASADYIFNWSVGNHPALAEEDSFVYVMVTPDAMTAPESGTIVNAAEYTGFAWEEAAYASTYMSGAWEPSVAYVNGKSYSDMVFNFIVSGGIYDGYVRKLLGGELSKYMADASGEGSTQTLNIGYYGFMIPEPSSALLLLLGAALVGLKRKVV